MFLIREDFLEDLLCFSCRKYLSVGPVKIYPNLHVRCGRCTQNSTCYDSGVEYMYNYIAKQCIFPCVNRYEGCNALLTYSDVSNHEKICLSTLYSCPSCSDTSNNQKMISFQFIDHFKLKHPKEILNKSELEIKSLKNEVLRKTYLYTEKHYLYVIDVTLVNIGKEKSLLVNIKQVRNSVQSKKVRISITIRDFACEYVKKLTIYRDICSINSEEDMFYLSFNDFDGDDYSVRVKFDIDSHEAEQCLIHVGEINISAIENNDLPGGSNA